MTAEQPEMLSPEEAEQLADALEDGFKDDYLPGEELRKINLGNLFDTNPLSDDLVYYRVKDGLNEEKLRKATSFENKDDAGFFSENSWETNIFWRRPFGFNIDKIEDYFASREAEVIEEQKRRYSTYLEEVPDIPLFWEERDTFEQWLEGRLFPYTKRWFEHHILNLIREIRQLEKVLSESGGNTAFMLDFFQLHAMKSAIILGRMVENYRWKFQYEPTIVSRRNQTKKAGAGGGKHSTELRRQRLEAFMSEIEKLGDMFPRVGENAIVLQAFENAGHAMDNFWKPGAGQSEKYASSLRSEQPFKSRYESVFKKNA